MSSLDHLSSERKTAAAAESSAVAPRGSATPDAPKPDLPSIRKAVEDAAAVSTSLWISYLFTLFYIAVAAGAVSHLDLLLESPVRLPFLGLELPLLAFFFLAPLIFLVAHAYVLVHFVMLGKKALQFDKVLHANFPNIQSDPNAPENQTNRSMRDSIRKQLPSNIFVQFLAGPRDVRDSGFGRLLRLIAWVTLVCAPIAVLLELQVQFLPFHHLMITWEHRLAVIIDIVLIWWLWRQLLGKGSVSSPAPSWGAPIKTLSGVALSAAVIWLSCSLATIPGEWQAFTAYDPLRSALFHGTPDQSTRRPASPFSNILVLPFLNVYTVLKTDDPQKVAWREYLLSLRGRDLRGAILDFAILDRTDAQNIQLQGASLYFTRLQGSKFDDAHLEGADLSLAQLQGASLLRAQVQGANLSGAGLQGAKLELASFVGADLANAQLQAANLRKADLRAVNFFGATLRGTTFGSLDRDTVHLEGAVFENATLDTVSFKGALLWKASKFPEKIFNIVGTPVWGAAPSWGPQSYSELQASLQAIPHPRREIALNRITSIACATPPDTPVCSPQSSLPSEVIEWRDRVHAATVDKPVYEKALADIFTDVLCSGDKNSLAIFRSLVNMGLPQASDGAPRPLGFLQTGTHAKALAEYVMNSKCPLSSQLSITDKAALLDVQRFAAVLSPASPTDAQPVTKPTSP